MSHCSNCPGGGPTNVRVAGSSGTARFFFVLASLIALAPGALAQEACEGAVQRAEESYFGGLFDNGINELTGCLENGRIARSDLEAAYALLGRLHFAKGDQGQARAALLRLFAHAPGYRADPAREEPAYLALVEDVREEAERAAAERAQARRDSLARVAAEREAQTPQREGEATRRRGSALPFVLAGVGAAAAGAAVLLLGGGEDPPDNVCNGPTVLTDVEPNSPSLPQVISASNGPPIRLTGAVTLEPSIDEDFFSVRINSPGITVSLTDLSADAQLYFGDFDQVHLASERPGTEDEVISANLPAGAYFIHVYPFQFGVSSISYTLNVVGDLDGCASLRVQTQVPRAARLPESAARFLPVRGRAAVSCEPPDGVALGPGWNTIRNVDQPRDWEGVASSNDISQSLWYMDGTWRADSLFRSGVTYHLYNDDDLPCLRLPPPGTARRPSPHLLSALELRAALDNGLRSGVRVRFVPEQGTDAFVDYAPPTRSAGLHLVIRAGSGMAAGTFNEVSRLAGAEGYRIPLSLRAPEASLVRLRLLGSDGSAGQRAVLIEEANGRVHELTGTGTAQLLPESSETDLALVVGSADYVEAQVQAAWLARSTATGAVSWPNPFRAQTTIRYSVDPGAPRHVRVEVLNLLGQRVQTLVDETQRPGNYEVVWDGTDATGSSAPSAPYVCRIQVGETTSALRLTRAR